MVLREILRRVELDTTARPGERRRLKSVIFVPHRGARVRLRSRRDAPAGVDRQAPSCPVSGPSPARQDLGGRGIEAVVRASVHYYNTDQELARLVAVVGECAR